MTQPGSTNIVVALRPKLETIIEVTGTAAADMIYIMHKIDDILDNYVVCIMNGYNVDIEHGHVTYVDENWVFIGAEMKADE